MSETPSHAFFPLIYSCMQQWHVRYLHGFSIDAGREAHDCDQGVHDAEGEETVLQNPAHYSHQLERDVLFYIR
jgi:hypothetical protein